MTKLRAFASTVHARVLVAFGVFAAGLGIGTAAFAQTATPYSNSQAVTDTTGYATSTFAAVAPEVLAIAGALISLALLVWGIRTVLHKVRGVSI